MSAADPTMEIFRGARIGRDSRESTQLVPEQRAVAAAVQVRSEFATDVGLAAIASESDGNEKTATVAVSLAAAIGHAQPTENVILPADRRRLRDFAVISLLNLLRRSLPA